MIERAESVELRRTYAPSRPAVRVAAIAPLLVVPGLLVSRLLPETGLGLGLRLIFATACVLLPGFLVARALLLRGISATLPLALAGVALAMTVMFIFGATITLGLIALAAVGIVALPFALRGRQLAAAKRGRCCSWPAASCSVSRCGGWRRCSRATRCSISRACASSTRSTACPARGRRVRRRRPAPGLRVPALARLPRDRRAPRRRRPGARRAARGEHPRAARRARGVRGGPRALPQLARPASRSPSRRSALIALAPGHGRRLQRARAARDRGAPAARPGRDRALLRATVATARARPAPRSRPPRSALALVHPTYAIFLACRSPATSWRARAAWRAASCVPRPHRVRRVARPPRWSSRWLLPLVQKTASHQPDGAAFEGRGRAVPRAARSSSPRRPLPARAGGVRARRRDRDRRAGPGPARRAHAAAPLVGVRARRLASRCSRSMLVPRSSRTFADLVSLSQVAARSRLPAVRVRLRRRAGGADALLGWLVLPVALIAGIVLQLAFPGDFGYRLEDGGPAFVDLVGRRSAARSRSSSPRSSAGRGIARTGRAAAPRSPRCCSSSRSACTASRTGRRQRATTSSLPPGLVARSCARTCPSGDVVFSRPGDELPDRRLPRPSTWPHAPPAHVADTKPNHPYERRADAVAVPQDRRPRDPAPLRRGLDRHRPQPLQDADAHAAVYGRGRFALYRS